MEGGLKSCHKPVRSLSSLLIDYVVDNLALVVAENSERLSSLPFCIKNQILQRFTTSTYFWRNIDFKTILAAITSEHTLSINLTATPLDDEILNIISKCKKVRKLYLTRAKGAEITTTGLMELLKNCPNLVYFVLTHSTAMNDEVLECMANNCPNLMALDIGGSINVTDVGISKISKLKKLSYVTFSSTQITDEGILHIVNGPSALKMKEFRIENTKVTDKGLQNIALNCENIEILSFCNKSEKDNLSCPTFPKELKHLKQLMWTVNW